MPSPCVCACLVDCLPRLDCFHLFLITLCVYSLCVPVFSLPVRFCFFMFLASQRFLVLTDLMLPTTARLTDYSSAFPVPDTLPRDRLPARVPTLDRPYHGLCRCLFLLGFVYICMDFLFIVPNPISKNSLLPYLVSESCEWIPRLYCTPYSTNWPKMDPADAEAVRAALRAQGERIVQTEKILHAVGGEMSGMSAQIGRLSEQFGQLMAQLTSPPVEQRQTPAPSADPAPSTAPAPGAASVLLPSPVTYVRPLHLSHPEKFSGESGDCRSFLVQCGFHFELQAPSFPTERSRVAYMVSYLTGRAEKWATAEWARDSPVCSSVQLFTETLRKVFDHTARGREAARALMDLRQGNRRVSTYAMEFRTLATESGWNEEALFDAFMRGLAESIRDHLTALELPNDVDSLIALVIKIDNRIQLREEERSRLHVNAPSRRGPATDPRLLSWRSPARFCPVAASPAPPRGFGGADAVGSYQTHGGGATTSFA